MSDLRYTGKRNTYRQGMPFSEKLAKDFRFWMLDTLSYLRNGMTLPVLVAYPDFPSKKTTLYKISRRLRFRLTNKLIPSPAVVIYFEDRTHGSSAPLQQHYKERSIINCRCTDISKEHTDEVHLRVFGYATRIDPLTYSGKAVQKSSENALHDGMIVDCPVAVPKPGSVYQLVIDNTFDEEFVVDYRVPVIGSAIPLVYKKFKKYEVRFTNEVSRSELTGTDAVFSADEQELLIRFAREMGATFCELDVLRNKNDGKLYVVDLNKTPYGPPAGLPKQQRTPAIQLLTKAFEEAFTGKGNTRI